MNKNAWRGSLDPRDPDYDEPPAGIDEEPPPEIEAPDYDPRSAGPWDYQPMRGDV